MSKNKTDKKLRRKKNQEAQVKADELKYDVIALLDEEPIQTKPEVGSFLKKYVKQIRVLVDNSKVKTYPTQSYVINKVFVTFLDGHEIIVDLQTDGKITQKCYLYDGLDEIELCSSCSAKIEEFADKLVTYKFV